MGFSVAEGIAGYVWAERRGADLAETRTLGLGGDFGMIQGAALGGLLDLEGRGAAALALAAGWGGIGLAHGVGGRRDHSAGDVTVLGTAGYVGLLAGLATADLVRSENDRWYGLGALSGSLAGLAAGDRLVRSTRFTEGQGRLVALGSLAGGAMGLGVAYLIVGGDDTGEDDSPVYLASSAVGAMAGYALTYRGLAPRDSGPALGLGGAELRIHPGSLLGLTRTGTKSAAIAGTRPLPLFSGTVRY